MTYTSTKGVCNPIMHSAGPLNTYAVHIVAV